MTEYRIPQIGHIQHLRNIAEYLEDNSMNQSSLAVSHAASLLEDLLDDGDYDD